MKPNHLSQLLCGSLLSVVALMGGWHQTALAATLTVTNTHDSGGGSLRQAVANASPGDTIAFSLTYPATITLTTGQININKDLTINGPGESKLTISGNNAWRVMSIPGSYTVSISGLRIANGKAPPDDDGGGIYNNGSLTLSDCTFSNNIGDWGGGLHNDNQLTVTNCTFSGNKSPSGGGFHNDGTATIGRSTFSGNSAKSGKGGGIMNEDGATLIVTDSTFANNIANSLDGGGIANVDSTLTVERSTFTGNTAVFGGAFKNDGNSASAQLINCTFSGNIATARGGAVDSGGGSALTVLNSTFVKNSSGIENPSSTTTAVNNIIAKSTKVNCSGAFTGGSTNNLATDATCSPGFVQKTSAQLRLGALTGRPAYYPLNVGSAAIDTGTNSDCPAIDERGLARPMDGDGDGTAICDVGSYEAEPPNDDFDLARQISSTPYNINLDTRAATTASDDPFFACLAGRKGAASVWFRYTPATNGALKVNTTGSNYDTVLAVWQGLAIGSLTSVACNDNNGLLNTSAVNAKLIPGNEYYVEVAGRTTGGALKLAATFTPKPPPAPKTLTPANGSQSYSPAAVLDWSDSPGATSYRAEVRKGSTIGTLVDSAQPSTSTYTTKPLLAGLNYWRAAACNSIGCNWSGWWYFKILVPVRPVLQSPTNGSTTAGTEVTVDWGDSTGATYYQVQVRKDTTSGSLVVDQKPTVSTLVTPTLLSGHWYFWRVRACSLAGRSAWTLWWMFKIP
jgi:Right handed beta helix region/Chlamydia polymorphic membrane protein (Chlamydia_PMP) repeat